MAHIYFSSSRAPSLVIGVVTFKCGDPAGDDMQQLPT